MMDFPVLPKFNPYCRLINLQAYLPIADTRLIIAIILANYFVTIIEASIISSIHFLIRQLSCSTLPKTLNNHR